MHSVKQIHNHACWTLMCNNLFLGMPVHFCSLAVLSAYQEPVVNLSKPIYASCAYNCNYVIFIYYEH